MNRSESINELAKALSIAQASIGSAIKEKKNSFYKKADGTPSLYADLESVVEAARIPLSENGLCVSQLIMDNNLETILMHTSGQWLKSISPLITKDNSIHSFVGAITYMRRASFAAIVGVVQADDDGNLAQGVIKNETQNRNYENKNQATARPQQSINRPEQAPPGGGKPTGNGAQSVQKNDSSPENDNSEPKEVRNESPISPSQAAQIYKMLEMKKRSVAQFNDYVKKEFGVESTLSLKVWQYNKLYEMLEAKH